MLNDFNPYEEYVADVTERATKTKELFGETLPYVIQTTVEGDMVVFSDRFMKIIRRSLTTGCMDTVSLYEMELINDFIGYQDTGRTISRNNTTAGNLVVILDLWIMNILTCTSNVEVLNCTELDDYTYNTCSN